MSFFINTAGFTFWNHSLEVPTSLTLRPDSTGLYLGFMLFVAFVILSVAKRMEPAIIKNTYHFFLSSPKRIKPKTFDENFSSTGFILIGVLFLISLTVGLSLFYRVLFIKFPLLLTDLNLQSNSSFLLLSFLTALGFIFYCFYGVLGASWFSGEKKLSKALSLSVWLNILGFSLVLFVFVLVWLLNNSFNRQFFLIFCGIISLFFLFRFFKLLIISFVGGVAWYYIILYFCTLEVMPIAILYGYFR